MNEGKRVIVIVGPTAGGKSELAFEIALKFNGEIVNADSMQVYRFMDIGVAKPSKYMMEKVFHHIYSVFDPSFDMNAGLYAKIACKCINEIIFRNKIPVVTGGTGLYIRALIDGLSEIPSVSKSTRKKVHEELREKGINFLYEKLKILDPQTAQRLKPKDTQRITRALEVYYETSKPISHFHKHKNKEKGNFKPLIIGLEMERGELYKKIEKRVDTMIENGLLEEVKDLLNLGFGFELKSMRGLGYFQVGKYISNEWSFSKMIEELKKEHRRYAKRQLTWFKNDKRIIWFHPFEREKIFDLVRDFFNL